MSNRDDKPFRNIHGPYYVDHSCIDCDLCRSKAPSIFIRNDDGGYTYVHRQPETSDEVAMADEARLSCPSESIGDDGESSDATPTTGHVPAEAPDSIIE